MPTNIALASPPEGFAIDPFTSAASIPAEEVLQPFPLFKPLVVGFNIDDIARKGHCERVLPSKGGLDFKFTAPKVAK